MLHLPRHTMRWSVIGCLAAASAVRTLIGAQAPAPVAPSRTDEPISISAADCTVEKLGASIPIETIGAPVRRVTLSAPTWTAETANAPAYCRVDGVIDPVDTSATARPINFGVALPARWNRRSVQMGGGGMNGTVPGLAGGGGPGSSSLLARGVVTYGSDSGHQAGFGLPGARGGGRPGGPGGAAPAGSRRARRRASPVTAGRGHGSAAWPGARTAPRRFGRAGGDGRPGGPRLGGAGPAPADDWALNDEAMANLGYMQMKKTHDAAMVLIERAVWRRGRASTTTSGRRRAVARRSPSRSAIPPTTTASSRNVPIVSFSTLMLAPELIRIQEKPLANWVTPAKVNAIRGEFMRQCDTLDGLADGIINNYMACRAIFDVTQGKQGGIRGRPSAARQRRSESRPTPAPPPA